jgi:hypothetical protein
MTQAKIPMRMTVQRKLDVYRKTRDANAPVGETHSVREYGLHLDDLRHILNLRLMALRGKVVR